MKLISNLFKPKWENTNPEVRIKAVEGLKNIDLLIQMSKNDENESVRIKAAERALETTLNDNKTKEYLLNLALNQKASELVAILINKGADINNINQDNETPLMIAIKKNMDKIALQLIENNANVNQYDKERKTALLIAIKERQYDIAKALINKGAEINFFDKPFLIGGDNPLYDTERITSPLIEAVGLTFGTNNDVTTLVELLLKKGANPNLIPENRNYKSIPLIKASIMGNKPVVELLLNHGADISLSDNKGKTALMYAEEEGKTEIVKIFKDWSSNENKTNDNKSTKKDTNTLDSFINMIENIEKDILNLKSQKSDLETNKNIFRQCMKIREIFRKANELMKLDLLLSDSQRETTTRIWNLSRDIVFDIPERINDRELLDSIADEVYDEIENNLKFN